LINQWRDLLKLAFLRIAAGGAIPAKWFLRDLPDEAELAARTGVLNFEIVTHCWNYAHFLAYQLSSIALFPPTKATVTMTVFYAGEDNDTCDLLRFFENIKVTGVTWNWQILPRERLFRRAIGRNQAALNSKADWIWFTDCDVLFRAGCLDTLATRLQACRHKLVYPKVEWVSPLLPDNDPLIEAGSQDKRRLLDVDDTQFVEHELTRATGPMQIAHGDVARKCGYCNSLAFYQKPAVRWRKAYEDRAFRWLLQSWGVGIDVPNIYRIRHQSKGRYDDNVVSAGLRGNIRRIDSWFRGAGKKSRY